MNANFTKKLIYLFKRERLCASSHMVSQQALVGHAYSNKVMTTVRRRPGFPLGDSPWKKAQPFSFILKLQK